MIEIDGRKFTVTFDEEGNPVRITERKTSNPGHPYLSYLYNAPYWSAKHHRVGKPTTIVARVLAAAKESRR